MKNSCLIIAGEQSGEDHALTFFKELKQLSPNTDFFGVGGDKLKAQNVELIYHLNDFSSMGITEVLAKLPFYFKAMDSILDQVDSRKCKTAILIDFQGFNLKLAKKLKKRGVKVLYYVAPQAWAWKAYRAKSIQKAVHTLFTILPFEKEWFKSRGVKNIKAVKHPLRIEYANELDKLKQKNFGSFSERKPRVLILPGSRNSEVSLLLPVFLKAKELIQEQVDCDFGIVKTKSVKEENYKNVSKDIKVFEASELLTACDWADTCIATSGTVTLATGLFGLPTVVSYKLSVVNEMILRSIINYTGAVSLTNIIHDKMLFPEFLHYEADRYNISREILKFLSDKELYNSTIDSLSKTKDLLSGDEFNTASFISGVINGSE